MYRVRAHVSRFGPGFVAYYFAVAISDSVFFLVVVSQAQREYWDVHALHRRQGHAALADADGNSSTSTGQEKERVGTVEGV